MPQPTSSTSRRGLAVRVGGHEHRPADGEDPVDAARHDEARQPAREPDVVEVARGEREGEVAARLVVEEADGRGHLEALREARDLALTRSGPDHDDSQADEVAQEGRRPNQRVEILGVPDVSRVHHDERLVEAALRRPLVVAWARRELRRVDPVRDHGDSLGRRPLVLEPQLHRVADRDDAVGALEVERDEPTKRAQENRLLESLHPLGDLGEDVLADDEQRHTEAARDDERDVPDDGRIGHAEDQVRPLPAQRGQGRVAEVAPVVRRAQVELCAVVRRRPDADDPHAVPGLLRRQVVAAQLARDDGHVVLPGELLAELREQLRGRLDPRPVVLVQHEDLRPGDPGHGRRR